MSSDRWAAQIAEFESQLEQWPEERGEILLDLAHACRRAGMHERAEGIWRELISEGGEDGDFARVELASHLLDVGSEEAWAELAVLKAQEQTDGGPWRLAAELFERHGDLAEALEWFTMATDRFGEQERAELTKKSGWASLPGMLIRARRRVREAMQLPPDDIDKSVLSQDEIERLFTSLSPAGEAPAAPQESAGVLAGVPAAPREHPTVRLAEMRTLAWQRAELPAAAEHWPALLGEDTDPDNYHHFLEAKLRKMAAEGITRFVLVPGTVDSLVRYVRETGREPVDAAARRAYLELRYAQGHQLGWPPPRNAPCWCGSSTKYKKCCGKPGG